MPANPTQRCVACPACGEPSLFAPGNRWRPFCSNRCAGVDLGAWASEGYRVAAADPRGDSNDDETPRPAQH